MGSIDLSAPDIDRECTTAVERKQRARAKEKAKNVTDTMASFLGGSSGLPGGLV